MRKFALSNIRYVVAVMAGKGGVGKSSLCVALSQTLKRRGYAIGALDLDIYGPSFGRMLPEEHSFRQGEGDSLIPGSSQGIKVFSFGYGRGGAEVAAVRAPIVNGIVRDMLMQIEWGELDYLFVDCPPGTGDILLTLMQEKTLSGVVLVSTPQEVALVDVKKSMQLCQNMGVPILGIIENMAYFQDPISGCRYEVFGEGKVQEFAATQDIPFLGQIPIDREFCLCLDKGEDYMSLYPNSVVTTLLQEIGDSIREKLFKEEIFIEKISRVEEYSFSVEWSDGQVDHFSFYELQQACPCQRCVAQETKSDKEVRALKIEKVGRYALRILFTSGCSMGMFTLPFLREFSKKSVEERIR